MRHHIKRATLFNEEVEGFTYGKYGSIKIGIVFLALFTAFVFTGWVLHELGNLISFMDIFTDATK